MRSYGRRWKPWRHCILARFEPCAACPRPGGRPTLAAPAPACAARRELSVAPSPAPVRRCVAELWPLETLETLHFGWIRTLRGPPSAWRAPNPRGPGTSVCGSPRAFRRALDRHGATLRCGDSFIFHSPGWEVIYSNSKKEPCCPALRGGPGRPGSPPGCQARGRLPPRSDPLPQPGRPAGQGGWRGPDGSASDGISRVRAGNFQSADKKGPSLPGSPRGPGEPWAPAGAPTRKPAAPTTRLSIRTRVPTLKHPPRNLQSQPLWQGGLTPGTPARFFRRALATFPGSPGGLRGTWLSGGRSGRPEDVPPSGAVRPDPGARSRPPARDPFNTQVFTFF